MIKKIIRYIVYSVISFVAAVVIFCAVIFLLYWLDPEGNCASDGNVWDSDLKECREDCFHWNAQKGCIKLTPEEVAEFKRCKYQSADCIAPLYDKMFPQKCLDYDGAYNLENGYCDFKFDLKDCGKLEGRWIYPPTCK